MKILNKAGKELLAKMHQIMFSDQLSYPRDYLVEIAIAEHCADLGDYPVKVEIGVNGRYKRFVTFGPEHFDTVENVENEAQ